jgi:SAM-dependent methyltransferase
MDWWKSAFSHTYADVFHRLFPEPTEQEIAYIATSFSVRTHTRVLDLACGEGRHAIPLARLGYEVTGVDISEDFLERAREKSRGISPPPTFLLQDIRTIHLHERFNLVLLIGNSFGYGTDADQQQILHVVAAHLDVEGSFLLSLPNGEKSMAGFEKAGTLSRTYELEGDPVEVREDYQFDAASSVKRSVWSIWKAGVRVYEHEARVRYYVQKEVVSMLESAGFFVDQISGNFDGVPFTAQCSRMVIQATKKKTAST